MSYSTYIIPNPSFAASEVVLQVLRIVPLWEIARLVRGRDIDDILIFAKFFDAA